MENASKALIMAGGLLVGLLILTLMGTLFMSSRDLSTQHEQAKKQQTVQQFNANFTKYVGKNLTIHQVVTITNFAEENGVIVNEAKRVSDIDSIINSYTNNIDSTDYFRTYKLTITGWSDDGYISSIKFE